MEEQQKPWYSLTFEKKAKKKVRSFEPPAPLAPIADTHAHLTCFRDVDPAQALVRAALAGVRQLTTLVDPVDDRVIVAEYPEWLDAQIAAARGLLDQVPTSEMQHALDMGLGDPRDMLDNVRFLAGVHPYGAARYTDAVHDDLLYLLDSPRCIGVGEIGLDYHLDADDDVAPAPHDVQIACMERQLDVALRRNLPVELHLRNDPADEQRTAHAEAFAVLRRMGIPAAGCVLHCFGEDRATMEAAVELGCYIAYGGAATFNRNEETREAFSVTPLDRILFETDCPYMAPMPIRGLECEPAMIAFTVDALSRDRAQRTGEDPVQIEQAAWQNARKLFAGQLLDV